MKYILLAFFAFLLFAGCKKEGIGGDIGGGHCVPTPCALKELIANDKEEEVKQYITAMIAGMPSQAYTSQNLQKLAQMIGGCGMTAQLACYDCIKTLPSQSEIKITLNIGGSIVEKVIDISYTPSNTMVFVHMH